MKTHRSVIAGCGRLAILAGVVLVGSVNFDPGRDGAAPTTIRVSVSSAGEQANRDVLLWGISADGRYVLMDSAASNLVPRDTNGVSDVFLRDVTAGQTVRVSVSSSGSQANASSRFPGAMTPDGRFVVFDSRASNLSVGKDTNGAEDVFVRDRELGSTRRVSIPPAGGQFSRFDSHGAAISADGRFVLFSHYRRAFLRDRVLQRTLPVGRRWPFVSGVGLSANARMVAYVHWPRHSEDGRLVIRDRRFGEDYTPGTDCCAGGTFSFTPNGNHAAYTGRQSATSEDGVYWWTKGGSLIRVIKEGWDATLTEDGTHISFTTFTPVTADDSNDLQDLFLRDLTTGATERVDVNADGTQIALGIVRGLVSRDGRWAAFSSRDAAVVPADTNGLVDVFLRGPLG
jgi:TolB protein